MSFLKPEQKHLVNIDNAQRLNNISKIKSLLDDIFRNGIKDPTQIPYVNQLLKEYYSLANTDYKINKENTIV